MSFFSVPIRLPSKACKLIPCIPLLLRRIVERDYFPELPYLRAKHELDEAVRSRDPNRVREAQSKLRKAAGSH